jgi:hypothetical protein
MELEHGCDFDALHELARDEARRCWPNDLHAQRLLMRMLVWVMVSDELVFRICGPTTSELDQAYNKLRQIITELDITLSAPRAKRLDQLQEFILPATVLKRRRFEQLQKLIDEGLKREDDAIYWWPQGTYEHKLKQQIVRWVMNMKSTDKWLNEAWRDWAIEGMIKIITQTFRQNEQLLNNVQRTRLDRLEVYVEQISRRP